MALVTDRKISITVFILVLAAFTIIGNMLMNPIVLALSQNEADSIYGERPMYDPLSNECSATSTSTPSNGNSLYIIGDSLTVGMNRQDLAENSLSSQLQQKGWSSVINAKGCRPLFNSSSPDGFVGDGSSCPSGSITSAFNELVNDRNSIASASKVIIALGTNNYEGSQDVFRQKMSEYIDQVKSINTSIGNNIYWVNLYTKGGGLAERSQIINEVVTQKGIQLIDFRAVATDEATYSFPSNDSTHHDNNGYINKAKLIVNTIGAPSGSNATITSTGGYDPTTLTYPAFPDESATANKLTEEIRSKQPSSPWLNIDPNFGAWLFRESKSRNVNPLLIAGIGMQENGYGSTNHEQVVKYYNYFGMKGSSPIDIPGSEYRGFSSPSEGIIFFIDTVKKNTQGSDRGRYASITNMYEYLAMHQSGIVAYPGEPLDPEDRNGPVFGANGEFVKGANKPDGNRQDGYDPSMGVYTSWEVREHPNTRYKGQIFNPGLYYKNVIPLINRLTGLSLTDTPSRGGSPVSGCTNESSSLLSGEAPGMFTKLIDGFVVYKQYDPSWASELYGDERASGDDRTIESSGCGPTAMAMIISTLTGKYVTPSETSAFGMRPESRTTSPAGGSNGVPLAEKMAANWGLKATFLGNNIEAINNTLRSGGFVIVSGQGDLPFSTGGHFVAIRAVTASGKWLVGDSSHRSAQPDTSTREYDPVIMANDFTAGGYSSYAITK